MITDNTINKITQVYLNKVSCNNIEQIKAAIKFAVKSTDKIIEKYQKLGSVSFFSR